MRCRRVGLRRVVFGIVFARFFIFLFSFGVEKIVDEHFFLAKLKDPEACTISLRAPKNPEIFALGER